MKKKIQAAVTSGKNKITKELFHKPRPLLIEFIIP